MSSATLDSPLMTTKQVAKILGRSEQVIRAMARNEEIGCVRRNSRGIQFTQQHIDDWITEHEVPAKSTSRAPKTARSPRYSK